MAEHPMVGVVNAERVVVAREIHGGIDLRNVQHATILTFSSGHHIARVFANVPAQGPPLIGRHKVFSELRQRIAQGGTVVVQGLPGAGKTALALALAYDESTLAQFSGGILWAGLGPSPNVGSILNLWGTALGVDLSGVPSTSERAQRLNAYLQSVVAGRPFVVVADDVWRWEDLADLHHLATPGHARLLTTRDEALARRLAGASEFLHVPELDEGAATELLTQSSPRARAVIPDELTTLVREVGGLPLALVLMGKELAAEGGHEPWIRKRVTELRSAKRRLALREEQPRPGLTGVPLTLRAAVELSLDAIADDATRTAFDELGVFAPKPADFTPAAAIAVWNTGDQAGDTRVRTLWGSGLLEATETSGDGRFTLHQVVAAVAADRLGERPDIAGRHSAYYLAFVERNPEAWAAIEPELPQIQRAWDWTTRAPGQDERVIQLLRAMNVFMERRGLRAQQRAWLERALGAARTLGDAQEEERLLGSLGLCCWALGQHGEAIDFLEQALALARRTRDRQSEGRHLGSLGVVWAGLLDARLALTYYDEALLIAREVNDRHGEQSHLGAIGLLWAEEGMARLGHARVADATIASYFQRAVQYYEQALTIAKQVGDAGGEASQLGNLGNAWRYIGDLPRAIDLLEQAVAKSRANGDRRNEGFHLESLGNAYRTSGDVQRAHRCWQDAAAVFEAYGDPRATMLKKSLSMNGPSGVADVSG